MVKMISISRLAEILPTVNTRIIKAIFVIIAKETITVVIGSNSYIIEIPPTDTYRQVYFINSIRDVFLENTDLPYMKSKYNQHLFTKPTEG
jgi:hypothetical protein